MKKTMILAAFAALVSLASCQKEEVIDNGPDNQTSPVFTASIAGATRTTVNLTDGKVAWEESDEITITDASSASAVYTIESIDATTGKATFVIKEGESAIGAGPYTATYGTEPATSQTYSATAGKLYMTAATAGNSFTFTVQCGLMKLNLTKTGESVKSIAVTSSTDATYTLTCDPAQSIATAKDFCIALPAGSYTKIEITNAEDITCTLNSASGVAVAANHIKPVTFGADKLNFAPVTTGTAKATIGGSEVDVNWIQLWEGGPKFAEYNVGTTSENKYGAYFAWAENIASTEWGDNWRMPTADEYQALLDNCTFSSEERNGVKGYVVTGKKGTAYALNSVFFPAGSGVGFGGLDKCGWYWSSSSISSERAWLLSFDISQSDRLVDGDDCTCRYTVRAVLNEAPALLNGALSGKFTINEGGDQVYFSRGNMYWDGDSFEFEVNQYDYPKTWDASHVGYFLWNSEGGDFSACDVIFTNETETTAKADFTVNGITGRYRSLSLAEWQYLFDHHSFRWTSVGGVAGCVIAPDGFSGSLSDSYSNDDALAADNLVFLPAAGKYEGDFYDVNSSCQYWSSCKEGDEYAFIMTIEGEYYYDESRNFGVSCNVRLVADVE